MQVRKFAVSLLVLGTGLVLSPAATAKDAPAAKAAKGEVAMRVGDREVSVAELDQKVRETNMQAFQALYDARKQAADAMVEDYLLENEAKARGVTVEQLIKAEVTDKVQAVTDEEVTTYFNQNQASMRGQTLEQAKPRIESFLASSRTQATRQAFLDGLKKKTKVTMLLEPPRVPVTVADKSPRKGSATAPVQIVEFSDFQCPFCSRVVPTMAQIQQAYGDKVSIVFRDFPLPMHQQATPAAEAAKCANAQGKFWEYHDKLFENTRALANDNLKQYAKDLGLDAAAFDKCFDSGQFKDAVQKDYQEGQKFGVRGTPAFFVNGRFVSGAQPFDAFKLIIDEELARHEAKKGS
jgi:protein-disulfide isomerase